MGFGIDDIEDNIDTAANDDIAILRGRQSLAMPAIINFASYVKKLQY
jgi:hypothetical protein